jgi:hypothetical protein
MTLIATTTVDRHQNTQARSTAGEGKTLEDKYHEASLHYLDDERVTVTLLPGAGAAKLTENRYNAARGRANRTFPGTWYGGLSQHADPASAPDSELFVASDGYVQ